MAELNEKIYNLGSDENAAVKVTKSETEKASEAISTNTSAGTSTSRNKEKEDEDQSSSSDVHIDSSSDSSSTGSSREYSSDAKDPDDDDDDDDDDDGGEDDDKHTDLLQDCYIKMPLLKYGRIADSLRDNLQDQASNGATPAPATTTTTTTSPLSVPCVCSTLGRVVIQPTRNMDSGGIGQALASTLDATNDLLQFSASGSGSGSGSNAFINATTNNNSSSSSSGAFVETNIQILRSKPLRFYLLAMAMEDGSIHVVNADTGEHVCSPRELKVYPNQHSPSSRKPNIVALSFDSGANYLSALTSSGDVAIFELKFGLGTVTSASEASGARPGGTGANAGVGAERSSSYRSTSSSNNQPRRPEKKLFDSFLSRLAGDERSVPVRQTSVLDPGSNHDAQPATASGDSDSNINNGGTAPTPLVLCLKQSVSTARFSYGIQNNETTKATCLVMDPSYNRKREKGILVGFSNGRVVYTKRSSHGGVTVDDLGFGGVMGSLLKPQRNDVELYQSTGNDGIGAVAWRGSLTACAGDSGIKIFDIDKMSRIAHIDKPSGARASLYPHISSLSPSLLFERNDSLLICWGDCLMNMTITEKKAAPGSTEVNPRRGPEVKCKMAWELDCVGCDVQPMDADYVVVLGLTSASGESGDDENVEEDKALMTKCFVELQIIKRADGSVTASDILPLASNQSSNEKPSTSEFALSSSFVIPRMKDSVEAEGEEADEEVVGVDIQNIILDTMASSINEKRVEKKFTDEHMRWSFESYKKAVIDGYDDDSDSESVGSLDSDDSDDYSFLLTADGGDICSTKLLTNVPTMVIRSKHDIVLSQLRDIDDSIEHARKAKLAGLALRHGLNYRRMLRSHTVNELIDDFLNAILNPFDTVEDFESPRPLSLRRLNIAAKSMPILIGSDIKLWEYWAKEFSIIPGALLLLRPHLPVRDPKLPARMYETFLIDMFTEIEEWLESSSDEVSPEIKFTRENAVELFLGGVRAWGTISSIRDRMKFYRTTLNSGKGGRDQTRLYREAESAFSSRINQTASRYLVVGSNSPQPIPINPSSIILPSGVTQDSLYNIDSTRRHFEHLLSNTDCCQRTELAIIETIAELHFMKGNFSRSLEAYINLGVHQSTDSIQSIEQNALKIVFEPKFQYLDPPQHDRFKHTLTMVETNDLHSVLLAVGRDNVPPLVALICLVGLRDGGNFIVDYCSLPESEDVSAGGRIFSFPLDMVAEQFMEFPALLLWLLHTVMSIKPDIYVQFPNTAVPSPAVTKLHQIHFDLYIKFTDRRKKSGMLLSDIPSFDEMKMNEENTLLRFLKAALPHGGIRSEDVISTLERCRMGLRGPTSKTEMVASTRKVEYPHLFAHELAFVIERSGSSSEKNSKKVLKLYLDGVASLPHAVEYTQRNMLHSSMLWDYLVSYCLKQEADGTELKGKIFGSLLEVAARSGSDLASLVSKIPKNMSIDGIRPRLVAAISDYQIKVKMHEAAFDVLSCDKVTLLREQYYRSRRGNRIDLYAPTQEIVQEDELEKDEKPVTIVLKPWKEGKTRLISKRKYRQGQEKRRAHIGINLPQPLEMK